MTITEISFARCLCNFIIAYLILQQKQVGLFEGVTRDMVLPLVLRCALGNLGFLAVTYTFKYLPLSVGTVIIATSPFAVAVLCSIFLKERVFRSDLIAIFVSFTGMAVMAYAKQGSSTGLTQKISTKQYITAMFVAIFAMTVVAIVAVCARFMKKLNFAVIQTHNGGFGVLFVGSILLVQKFVYG